MLGQRAEIPPEMTLQYPVDQAGAEAALESARKHLGEESFARAWAEGVATSLGEAVEYALQETA